MFVCYKLFWKVWLNPLPIKSLELPLCFNNTHVMPPLPPNCWLQRNIILNRWHIYFIYSFSLYRAHVGYISSIVCRLRQVESSHVVHHRHGDHGLFLLEHESKCNGFEPELRRPCDGHGERCRSRSRDRFAPSHRIPHTKRNATVSPKRTAIIVSSICIAFYDMLPTHCFCSQNTLLEWRNVFWISGGVVIVANSIYLVLASASIQWWNDPVPTSENDDGGM